ncbi:hypothetical protein COV16_03595 [Candidatus Woesearchaeota archaeon CG10_big_fil_rev_8_21_14_0_10_34_8]|nr:MAG: hypothetical protein COV16_03595 [Candidatus Woesearchaeota archaeon CG10_big_fil_rev_8_21_14_0_10_34_8]
MKKAQLKTGETIIVLIIFFILLAGGMVFYAKIQTYTSVKKVEEVQELNAIAIEQRIRHMSEISCTIDGSVIFDCYDIMKVEALQETIEDYKSYYGTVIFPNSRVVITSVYPDNEEVVLYDYGYSDESVAVEPFRTPVTLYNPRDDTYNFGYITIGVYS